MKRSIKYFYNFEKLGSILIPAVVLLITSTTAATAAVVQRGGTATANRAPVARANNAAAIVPIMTAASETVTETVTTTPTTATDAPTNDIDEIIENKSSQFDEVLSDINASAQTTTDSQLSENIRRQRAALDSAAATDTAKRQAQNAAANGQNACDQGLRKCMQSKCGDDFSQCKLDDDTIWGGKVESCKRDLPCSGEEYALFAREIKADRDANAQLASYNAIINCGNDYNNCIMTQCGTTFAKCLGKKNGDAAIAACEKIAKNCVQQDSGLASRSMNVFATLRQNAEKQVQADEKKLYELRDQMRSQCQRLGAMLDERTMDCVFTVEFYAGEGSTLYASKKAYPGTTFDCTPNWFGVDITTFKENAYRLTREQESATSAFMGAGVGVAAGAITSGAINRAMDTQKAKRALKKEEKAQKKAEKEKETQSELDTNSKKSPEADIEFRTEVTKRTEKGRKLDTKEDVAKTTTKTMEDTISKGTDKLDEKAGIKLENNKTFEKQILDNAPKGGVLEQVKNERNAESGTTNTNTKYSLGGVSGLGTTSSPSLPK